MVNFCSECGASTTQEIPDGDSRIRDVCTRCGQIHYQNPRIVVGCVVEHQEHILMCQRAINPAYGLWTLPGGFMENGESTMDGACRETQEEAGAIVTPDALFAVINIPHIDQVHIFYRARMTSPVFSAGPESLTVSLLREEDIPWSQIAFSSVRYCLKAYFEDRRKGRFRTHETVLSPSIANA